MEEDIKKELISEYRGLPIEEKRKELGWEITQMHLTIQKLIKDLAPDFQYKDTNKYDNLFDAIMNEQDYLTGLYEDFLDMKNDFGLYCDAVIGAYYKNDNKEGE